MTYDDFRTGFSFADIRAILKSEQNEKYASGQYMFVSRSTVLGRWREYKLQMWQEYQASMNRRNGTNRKNRTKTK